MICSFTYCIKLKLSNCQKYTFILVIRGSVKGIKLCLKEGPLWWLPSFGSTEGNMEKPMGKRQCGKTVKGQSRRNIKEKEGKALKSETQGSKTKD